MSKMNVAVFFGSRSCEHDVSIVSALQLIEAVKAAGQSAVAITDHGNMYGAHDFYKACKQIFRCGLTATLLR